MQRVVNSSSSCRQFSEYFTSQLRLYVPQDACVSIRGIMKVLGGFIFGFTVAFLLRRWRMSFVKDVRPRTVMQELGSRQLLFIGVMSVMTAEKFRNSRPRPVFETWGQTVPGKLQFFSSGISQKMGVPVVSLPGVDDSYPPQRKSMMMLKYMHDNYIEHQFRLVHALGRRCSH